jgi:hypothetical protein
LSTQSVSIFSCFVEDQGAALFNPLQHSGFLMMMAGAPRAKSRR